MNLYSYFRSSAAYRVRIALALKGLSSEIIPVNLVENEQKAESYRSRNPQGLVPALELDDGTILGQSLAILEWLEETHPEPALYPMEPLAKAAYRAHCLHIACDIHPLNNLRVLRYLGDTLELDQQAVGDWYSHWIQTGFNAIEKAASKFTGDFSLGDKPGMFEVMLVPQLYNARRFKVAIDDYPAIIALDTRCTAMREFHEAHPGRQIDTPDEERLA
ncbi:MAG: maleylacetoacetate isomerase [Pseudomonadota bacterium]